jgi:F-type H+-transporting ATPase subunit delta
MKQIKCAREYAKAFFSHASKIGQAKQVQKEMKSLFCLKDENFQKLKVFFKNSILSKIKKKEFSALFFANFSKVFLKYVNFLIESKKENLLFEIASFYEEIFCQSNKIEKISISSAFVLSEDLKKSLEGQIKKLFRTKEYLFHYFVNPTLIGGALIEIKDKRWDFSLKNKLFELKNHLMYFS